MNLFNIINNRRYFYFLIFSFFLFFKTSAQDSSAFIVIGIEVGWMNQNLLSKSETINLGNRLLTGGVVLEIPLKNKISIGTGLIYSRFGGVKTFEKSGVTRINDDDIIDHEILNSDINLSYISIPIRVIHRLKCNCVYTQLGIQSAFYFSKSNRYNYNNFYTTNPENYLNFSVDSLNKVNWIAEFGIGFKANFKENIRLIILPSYQKVLNPFFSNVELSSRSFMKIAFSFQYAFLNKKSSKPKF